MYGMVNQAFKQFVVGKASAEQWMQIARKAGESGDDYLVMKSYADDVTYALVANCCSQMQIAAADLLFEFGKYWIHFARQSPYQSLLADARGNLFDMLRALDKMHYQIARNLPDLRPPSFRVKAIDARTVHLLYYSERAGLEDFVRGLIAGLGELYGITPEVSLYLPRDAERNYATFSVTIP